MVNQSASRVVLIGAVASGQGKTTLTAALARKLTQQGQRVRVFKTGPDFLDPMLLQQACGSPVHTLDLWIVGQEQCRQALARAARAADVVLIEGVMGLYDGNPSAADLARAFGVPIVLVIDAGAMAQTAGALALGLRDYGPSNVVGVIANKVGSAGHADMVATSLRDIPLLGRLPLQENALPERHLGLLPPNEVDGLDTLLDKLAAQLVLDEAAWQSLPVVSFDDVALDPPLQEKQPLSGKVIAIARDAAFVFLYPANLECLRALGATLVFFSPLANESVPHSADAVYLPGGYPELHARALSEAIVWNDSIRAAHAQGKPIWAECGGMMALAENLTDKAGASWPMAGLLPGTVAMQSRLAGLGSQALTTSFGDLRGHTFHYSQFTTSQAVHSIACKHPSGSNGEALYANGSLHASYFHAYFPSCPEAVAALFGGVDPFLAP